MNSYNESLHFTVLSTLKNLDLEQQNLKSQVNAAMFTLYHAQGATIRTEERAAGARIAFGFKAEVQHQAVKDNNLSVNLLNAANLANQDVQSAVCDVAVCASNVQLAANVIVRLASDIGSIFSIVNAADFDSDIYVLAANAHELIDDTAYDAELASQLAMEASMLTAEISSSTVWDMAKTTNSLMGNLLRLTSADLDAAAQTIASNGKAMATASANEKLAEGSLLWSSAAYKATKSAYGLTNKELNINLEVDSRTKNGLSFTVDFDLIRSPFSFADTEVDQLYPVRDYFLIVVKENKKQVFSVSSANHLLSKGNEGVIRVNRPEAFHVSQEVSAAKDSDHEEIRLGINYVVFVMAVYTDDYKRKINCYDDYLSAPSEAFRLTKRLESIPGHAITVTAYNRKELSAEELTAADSGMEDDDYKYKLNFYTGENLNTEVAYRCMLLPYSPDADHALKDEPLQLKPGFLFNVVIAGQVAEESYTLARKLPAVAGEGNGSEKPEHSKLHWVAFFGPDTTDNFGDMLMPGKKYLPVILSYSTAGAAQQNDFVNALSAIATTDYFQY